MEDITVERAEIWKGIADALKNTKGIGKEKAEAGSAAVMKFLDTLVEQQEGGEDLGSDDEGIKFMKRPDGVPEHHNYLYWDEGGSSWSHSKRPSTVNGSNYTCDGIGIEDEKPHGTRFRRILPDEPDVRNRIRRLI